MKRIVVEGIESSQQINTPLVGALKRMDAADLGVSYGTLWNLVRQGRIHKTSYGTYAIEELQRHLREETQQTTVERRNTV